MSPTRQKQEDDRLEQRAPLFAALGDETRLTILKKLAGGSPLSITQLTEGSPLTRQAITKHLRVLEEAGLVHGSRQGRENLFRVDPAPLKQAKDSLDIIAQQWENALGRLKSFVEE